MVLCYTYREHTRQFLQFSGAKIRPLLCNALTCVRTARMLSQCSLAILLAYMPPLYCVRMGHHDTSTWCITLHCHAEDGPSLSVLTIMTHADEPSSCRPAVRMALSSLTMACHPQPSSPRLILMVHLLADWLSRCIMTHHLADWPSGCFHLKRTDCHDKGKFSY